MGLGRVVRVTFLRDSRRKDGLVSVEAGVVEASPIAVVSMGEGPDCERC